MREWFTEQGTHPNIYKNKDQIIVSDLVEIEKEWRCFVIDGQPASFSVYAKENGKSDVKPQPNDFEAYQLSNFVDLYDPTKSGSPYVVDICKLKDNFGIDNYKIVEYNAFQCSGFYACDVEKILRRLINFIYFTYGN